jgi:hypothetical protein
MFGHRDGYDLQILEREHCTKESAVVASGHFDNISLNPTFWSRVGFRRPLDGGFCSGNRCLLLHFKAQNQLTYSFSFLFPPSTAMGRREQANPSALAYLSCEPGD